MNQWYLYAILYLTTNVNNTMYNLYITSYRVSSVKFVPVEAADKAPPSAKLMSAEAADTAPSMSAAAAVNHSNGHSLAQELDVTGDGN